MSASRKHALKGSIDLTEKEILCFTGKKRAIARRRYRTILKSCTENCSLEKPNYIKRT